VETTKYLEKRAAGGDANAAFRLGYRSAFGRGRGKPADWKVAARWWKQAAKSRHVRAEFYLGTCFEHGKGVRKDVGLGVWWYMRAAYHGDEVAQYNVAFSFREGNGVVKDIASAIEYYEMSVAQGVCRRPARSWGVLSRRERGQAG
jgi:uncharacterized protein